MNVSRVFLVIGSVLGLLAVALGAFGAHGLKSILEADLLAVFETGVRYQFYHALALIAVGVLARGGAPGALRLAGWSFVGGIALFSGSLYILALSGIRWLGAITPFGGVAFLLGWAALTAFSWKSREKPTP